MSARFAVAVAALALLAGCPPKQPVPISGGEPTDAPAPAPGKPPKGSTQASGGSSTAGTAPAPSLTPSESRAPVQDRVTEASDLIQRGGQADLDRAIKLLESAVADDRTGIVRFDLGLAYQRRGDLKSAQSQFQTVIAADPANGDAWLCLGYVHELEGDNRAALSSYETGVANAPDNLGLRVALVNGLRKVGRVDDAIAAAKEALRINTKAIEVYNALGLAYLEKKNIVLAKFVFQKAEQEIDGAKNNAVLQTNIGWTYYLDDNKPEATSRLQHALETDPNLVPALVYLSKVYMEDKNYADTVPLLENAARMDPNNADVQLTLGVAYRGVGRLDDAERAYQRALAIDPSDPAPHLNLGVLKGDYRKDYDGAVQEFNAYIAANGSESALAQDYIKAVQREKDLSDKRAKAELERKQREEERKRKEQEQPQPQPQPAEPAPDDGGDAPEVP